MAQLYNQKFEQPLGYIEEHVSIGQFTDGGSAAGTYVLKSAIPAKAQVLGSVVTNVAAFTGNTTAALTIGDGSDPDRYNTGTPSVFTAAAAIAAGVPSGVTAHTSAVFPTLTITSTSDFTAVTAGSLDVRIVYIMGMG